MTWQWAFVGDAPTAVTEAGATSPAAPGLGLVYQPAALFPTMPPGELDTLAAEGPEAKPIFTPPPKAPAPTLVTATTYAEVRQSTSGVEQWRGLVASIFPEFAVDTVLRVMQCESGGNPNAVSPTNDHGLMQINAVNFARFGGRSPYDPEANLEVAYAMSAGGTSFWAWSCKP